MKPVRVGVVTNMLTIYTACNSCRLVFNEGDVGGEIGRNAVDEYPGEMKEDSSSSRNGCPSLRAYRNRIRIRMWTRNSVQGFHVAPAPPPRLPCFIVDGKDVVSGGDRESSKYSGWEDGKREEEKDRG